jgi:hypothetical protein
MPPNCRRFLTAERRKVVYEQVEALVQIGANEAKPHLSCYIHARTTTDARVNTKTIRAFQIRSEKVLDDVTRTVTTVPRVTPMAAVWVRNNRRLESHIFLHYYDGEPPPGIPRLGLFGADD